MNEHLRNRTTMMQRRLQSWEAKRAGQSGEVVMSHETLGQS